MQGAATGSVRSLLRLEGLCVLAVSAALYARLGAGWGVFAACFLLPDVSFLGYLAGRRVGAVAYNAAHSYVGAALCAAGAMIYPDHVPAALALIWCAHIGFDRALGYGLKYRLGFGHTHLGLIGRAARLASSAPVEATAGHPLPALEPAPRGER